MQSKMVFKICEGISCSSFCVKEFAVIVHKKTFSLYNPIKISAILYPKSSGNLLVEVGTRHSHSTLLEIYSHGKDVLVSFLSSYHIWESSVALSSVMGNWSYIMVSNAETVSIWWHYHAQHVPYIDGLVQERRTLAMKLRLFAHQYERVLRLCHM